MKYPEETGIFLRLCLLKLDVSPHFEYVRVQAAKETFFKLIFKLKLLKGNKEKSRFSGCIKKSFSFNSTLERN